MNKYYFIVAALGYRDSEPMQPGHRPLEEIVKFF